MKKTAILFSFLLTALCVLAQGMPQVPQLPTDPDVRIGKLKNGLTYYIRHNEKPKGQASFHIAQKVGSILEEEHQRGLAHFLEHMAFNGTSHFPDSMIVTWCESVGIRFGSDLNAGTGMDETVYTIDNVPTARVGVQDSVLLILHDWANDLLLTDKEIDKERSVIHEEWRSRNVAQQRQIERMLPKIYGDSKYATRLPIGTMEVVDNFPYQALRDYYETWYRPDLQGIFVVGDVDVDRIEAKIKELFSDIEMPKKAPKRKYEKVGDHEGTIYAIESDPEQTMAQLQVSILSDPLEPEMKNTQFYYVNEYLQTLIDMMLNSRLGDLANKPETPFTYAGVGHGGFFYSARAKDANSLIVVPKDGQMLPALEAAYREMVRAYKTGFSEAEFERAKAEFASQIDRAFNERDTRTSRRLINELTDNFLNDTPIPGIETEYMLYQQLMAMLPLDAINQGLVQMPLTDNRVVWGFFPEGEGKVVPTDAEIAAVLDKVDNEKMEALVEEVRTDPLIPNLPAPGKIVDKKTNDTWGTTEYTLSNGATVVVKVTDFKKDEVRVLGVAMDGTSGMSEEYYPVIIVDDVISANGLGTYTQSDLRKYLMGKQASVNLSFDTYTRILSGSAVPKDMPTLMELIFANMTEPYYDAAEFDSMKHQLETVLKNQAVTPDYQFGKLVNESLYTSPTKQQPTLDDVAKLTPEMATELSLAMTSNAADWTFFFVGNIDLKAFEPLMEQYIAALPGMPGMSVKNVAEFHAGNFIKPGNETHNGTAKMDTPQTYVAILAAADLPYTVDNMLAMTIAGEILSARLVKNIREEMGAVYSIGAAGGLAMQGPMNAVLQTVFPMKPELKQQTLDAIRAEILALQSTITPEELAKVKEYLNKSFTESRELNGGWLNGMLQNRVSGVDTFNTRLDALNDITIDDVQNVLKQFLAQDNYQVIVLDPEQ